MKQYIEQYTKQLTKRIFARHCCVQSNHHLAIRVWHLVVFPHSIGHCSCCASIHTTRTSFHHKNTQASSWQIMFAQPEPMEPRRLLQFSQSSQPTQSQPVNHNLPSQPQPTPTGLLADKLCNVSLASQPTSRFRPLLSTQDVQMSQLEMLG